MSHPLQDLLRNAQGFVLIGDSSQDRFPPLSYTLLTKATGAWGKPPQTDADGKHRELF